MMKYLFTGKSIYISFIFWWGPLKWWSTNFCFAITCLKTFSRCRWWAWRSWRRAPPSPTSSRASSWRGRASATWPSHHQSDQTFSTSLSGKRESRGDWKNIKYHESWFISTSCIIEGRNELCIDTWFNSCVMHWFIFNQASSQKVKKESIHGNWESESCQH